ncbi:hypothetical protein B0H21DRAFT_824536 [Amylocystis lapponica]|nr:hypothetical protein B0H21DRAFT_824536 [Amylocystis lapponica]
MSSPAPNMLTIDFDTWGFHTHPCTATVTSSPPLLAAVGQRIILVKEGGLVYSTQCILAGVRSMERHWVEVWAVTADQDFPSVVFLLIPWEWFAPTRFDSLLRWLTRAHLIRIRPRFLNVPRPLSPSPLFRLSSRGPAGTPAVF